MSTATKVDVPSSVPKNVLPFAKFRVRGRAVKKGFPVQTSKPILYTVEDVISPVIVDNDVCVEPVYVLKPQCATALKPKHASM